MRIGTTHKVQSANLLLDPNLSLLAHISNPTLMKMNQEAKPVGQLAKRIEPSPNLKSWTIVLREDLYWSDGKKFTTEDVKFTVEYLQKKYPPGGWLKKFVSRIELRGENELIVHLNQPYGRLAIEFTTYPILPRHIWEKVDNPMRYTNPDHNVGCGPFVIEKVDLNRSLVVFYKNPFWKGPQPNIAGIEVHIFRNRDVLALALEKGEVDVFYEYASSYPYANLRMIKKNPDFGYLEKLNMGLYFLGWNLYKKPMSDVKFRKALSYALDYPEILKLMTLGNGRIPTQGFVPPSLPDHIEMPSLEFDLNKAQILLEEAGYKDSDNNGTREDQQGNDLRLTLLIDPVRTAYARISELIQEYFGNVGIRVDIQAVEGNSWVNLKDNYHFDIILSRSTPWGMMMHAGYATGYFDARRTGEGVLHTVDSPVFLKMCDELLATDDPGLTSQLAHAIQDYYAVNLPAIPLYWNTIITPYNKNFTGWTLDPLYGLYNIDSVLNLKSSLH